MAAIRGVDLMAGINAFNESLARTESGGNYSAVNSEGYGGKYQFGQGRLDDFNRANGTSYTVAQFVQNPQLQEYVQDWHVRDIDSFAQNEGLTQYLGQSIGGVTITQDGMRAMAHLGGKGGLKKYLESGGQYNPSDSNGTSLRDYAETHAGGGNKQQQPQNALAYQQPEAPQRPQLIGATNNAADFMRQPNQLASIGFDQQTNPFLQYMRQS